MTWNWQHKNWPEFTYDTALLAGYEKDFLHNAGMLHGSLRHVNSNDQDMLKVMLISDEAYKTSEIEGELLDRDSLQSSIRKHFGIKGDTPRASPAEQGISEMMVDLYKNYHSPLSHQQLCHWHALLAKGHRDLLDIGSYRTHDDPMQIVTGLMNRPRIHYEAPPSNGVKKEMDLFISWFNSTESLDPLTRSGIAHLYFESIHPFEDGNGRIGRAISEKALSQSLQRPTLIAISHTIAHAKKKYYEALHQNSIRLDITEWLVYFCEMVLQAQSYTQSMINFLIEKAAFYQRFETKLNERQQKVVARIFKEGIHGFQGGLSADNYRRITKTTASTATRDLQKLVELEAFRKTGERKGTRYYLNIDHPA